jgi:hypothetical protein
MALADTKPEYLPADKGYDSTAIRDDHCERGIRPIIPPRSNRITPICWHRRLSILNETASSAWSAT